MKTINTKIFSIIEKVKKKRMCCVIWDKYRKLKKPKISYIFEKTFVLSISKCKNEDEILFKE